MKKSVLLLVVVLSVLSASAQKGFWLKPDYGLNFHFNLPVIKSVSSDTLSMKSEWGGSMFFEWGHAGRWGYQSSLGFDRVRYNHNFTHQTTLNSNINLGLTAYYAPPKMQGTRFFVGLEPNYTLASKVASIDGSQGSGTVQRAGDLDQPLDLGIQAGISFQFKPSVALQIAYKEMVHGNPLSSSYDGLPDQIQIKLQVAFNKIESSGKVDKKQVALDHTNRLRDSSLIIFVLNDFEKDLARIDEEDDRTNAIGRIDEAKRYQVEAIKQHYRFSEYIICYEKDFTDVLTANLDDNLILQSIDDNQIIARLIKEGAYVARVGEFVIHDNQSSRSGVFIYNSQMQLLASPFPFFTGYLGLEPYMNDEKKLKAMMLNLEEKLRLLYAVGK